MSVQSTETPNLVTPSVFGIGNGLESVKGKGKQSEEVKGYLDLFEGQKNRQVPTDSKVDDDNKTMVASFYDIVTDFYEYGWGESFHFSPRYKGESFNEGTARSEHYMALRLGLKPSDLVLDAGCGVGGPMRSIARFSGAKVMGINICEYQLARAKAHNKREGLDHLCSVQKADFTKIPVEDNHFNHVYAFEATEHCPIKENVYKEIFRVLKPGGCFGNYEWCMTDKYDENNKEHEKIKYEIEKGNGLPPMDTTMKTIQVLKDCGFEIIEEHDFGVPDNLNPRPWWTTLDGQFTLSNFRFTRIGRWLTDKMVYALESVKVAPQGSWKTSQLLSETADYLVEGGKHGIFTPNFFFVARKPLNKE